jgi:hypothetical protein
MAQGRLRVDRRRTLSGPCLGLPSALGYRILSKSRVNSRWAYEHWHTAARTSLSGARATCIFVPSISTSKTATDTGRLLARKQWPLWFSRVVSVYNIRTATVASVASNMGSRGDIRCICCISSAIVTPTPTTTRRKTDVVDEGLICVECATDATLRRSSVTCCHPANLSVTFTCP